MAFVPLFTVSQPIGAPSNVTLSDVSTGSDVDIVGRKVYISTWNGSYLVESGVSTDYETWLLADTSITLNLLPYDEAVRIVVEWISVTNVVLYDKVGYYGLVQFNEEFDYGLTQNVAANPLLINDNSFWMNKLKLRILIESGNNAIENVSDIYSAQQCYNLATELRNESQYYFNINS